MDAVLTDNRRGDIMTDREVSAMWESECLPYVVKQYELDGQPDYVARRESFNDYTDMLCKDGVITDEQYDNMEYVGNVKMDWGS